MSRWEDIPVYEKREEEIPAKFYNIWRRAKLHLPEPIRIPLNDLKGLVLMLEPERWVCLDEQQNELPVAIWFAFEAKGRESLHEPIKCKLNLYHFAAHKITDQILGLMEASLQEMLDDESDG